MEFNQCGPSNAMKDFSRLTLEDRSRYQDRFVGNGANSQNFRSGMNNGNQANADFAGFQSGSSGLPATPQTNFSQLPGAYAGYNAQFQPAPSVGGSQGATSFQGFRPAAQPSTRFDGYAAFNAARLAQQSSTSQSSGYSTPSPVYGTPGQMPNSAFGPAPGLMPGAYGAAAPQAGFSPFAAQAPFAFRPQMAPNTFHSGQSQAIPSYAPTREQEQEARALQERYDSEFEKAMDDWMAEHGPVTGQADVQSSLQSGIDQSTQLDGATQQGIISREDVAHDVDQLARAHEAIDTATDMAPMESRPADSMAASNDAAVPTSRSELSVAAQKIIDSVADNDSEKFKNSAFLRMMRGLAKEEIVLEGNEFVHREGSTTADPAVGSGSHVTGSKAATQPNAKGKGRAVTVEDYYDSDA